MVIYCHAKWINDIFPGLPDEYSKGFIRIDSEFIQGLKQGIFDALSRIPDDALYVGIKEANPLLVISSCLAAWEHGIYPIILNPEEHAAQTGKTLKKIGSEYILSGLGNKVKGIRTLEYRFAFNGSKPPKIQHLAGVGIFTSGSTSGPKCVIHTPETLLASYSMTSKFLKTSRRDSWLLSLPIHHIGGFSIFFRALAGDNAFVVPESYNYRHLLEAVRQTGVNMLSVVPAQLREMLRYKSHGLSETKAVLLGGSSADNKLIQRALKTGIPLYKVYGATETAAFVVAATPGMAEKFPDIGGKPLTGVHLKIEKSRNGDSGEILVKSPSLSMGYEADEKATADRFRKGWYHTGDEGYLDSSGNLYVLGRMDNIIITGGVKVLPGKVKAVLQKTGFFDDVEVIGLPDVKWGRKVTAVFTLKKNRALSVHMLKEMLTGALLRYEIPKLFYIAESIPKTSLGKSDMNALLQMMKKGACARLL